MNIIKDSTPDYIGIWRQPIVKNIEDFSLFFVWSKEGFCIDNIGKAKIKDWKIDDKQVSFIKEYSKACSGNIKDPITYKGTFFHGDYVGEWDSQKKEGYFVLSTHISSFKRSNISEMLWQCERDALLNKIREKRNQLPFSGLKEIEF